MSGPRVLFVSKPIEPPFRDGSKNLVRDVVNHLAWARPTVLVGSESSAVTDSLGAHVRREQVYAKSRAYAPRLRDNARVFARLVAGDPQDAWHFFFAPNAPSSTAARAAIAARRMRGWRGPVVQTVVSRPDDPAGVRSLLFGDRIVVLSEYTRGVLLAQGIDQGWERSERARRLVVIPPCASAPPPRAPDALERVRGRYGLGDGPIVLYPGDYEVSTGAQTVARAAAHLVRALPHVRVVFACRAKTPRADAARRAVERATAEAGLLAHVRHVGEVDDFHDLLAASTCVAFPVDDLYGKVDLPIVLLEALAMGIPTVVASGGPLIEIGAARVVPPQDPVALAREIKLIAKDPAVAHGIAKEGKAIHGRRFAPAVVARQHDDLYRSLLVGYGP